MAGTAEDILEYVTKHKDDITVIRDLLANLEGRIKELAGQKSEGHIGRDDQVVIL